jgi:hypothetical protein
MNYLETSIIIQKELDKCNEKIKQYEIKYNTEKLESLKTLYHYLNAQIISCDEIDQKLIMDDIYTLSKYLDIDENYTHRRGVEDN